MWNKIWFWSGITCGIHTPSLVYDSRCYQGTLKPWKQTGSNNKFDLKLVVEGTFLLIFFLESDGKLTIPFPESYQTCHNDEMILPDIQVRMYV